jgi:uracil-DNA glycosylase
VDFAKSLADETLVELRREALAEAHLAPLTLFVEALRHTAPAGVPDFDPMDGGVNAECLFLLEAPGSKAVSSGFVSRNNPDETAKNFFHLNVEAGLPRRRTIIWNAVPWYIGTGNRIRAASKSDLSAAEVHTRQLLSLLRSLRVIVLVGRKAQRFSKFVRSIVLEIVVLKCPHPSPLSLNGRPERRSEILHCLTAVTVMLGSHAPSSNQLFQSIAFDAD